MSAYLVTLATGVQVQRLDLAPGEGEQFASHIELPRLMLPCERWDGAAIVDDLPALRGARWSAVKAARDMVRDGGCATPAGRADSDPASRGLISGAVQMALLAVQMGEPFSIEWTMADNSLVQLDAPGMLALGIAVGRHVDACHAEGASRRLALDAAESRQEIEAVPVLEGWPGA